VLVGATPHESADSCSGGRDLVDKAGLADTGITGDDDQTATPGT
jgi:hypothetical protein